MIKWPVSYVDYNGEKQKEDFWFNLSKFELTEMQVSTKKGFAQDLQDSVDNENVKGIIMGLKDIILKAYGVKTEDGKHFLKKDKEGNALADMFAQTEAFSELYMELLNNDDKATKFMLGVIPADMAKTVSLQMKTTEVKTTTKKASK